jgi:hypothetical protein
LLVRRALDAGTPDDARSMLARVDAAERARPEIEVVARAIEAAERALHAPAERAVEELVNVGDLPGAEQRARELAALWPESRVARRVLGAAERRIAEETGRRASLDADDAMARGAHEVALAYLGRAAKLVPEAERAEVQARIDRLRAQLREASTRAEIERVAELLADHRPAEAVATYLGLSDEARTEARARSKARELFWAELLRRPGTPAPRITPAVLAAAAAENAAGDVDEALRALEHHEEELAAHAAGRELLAEIRVRAEATHRIRIREMLDGAATAIASARIERARAFLSSLRNLTTAERAEAGTLAAKAAGVARVSDAFRHGNPGRAWRDADLRTTCRACGLEQTMSRASVAVDEKGTTYSCGGCGARFVTVRKVVGGGYEMDVAGDVELKFGG